MTEDKTKITIGGIPENAHRTEEPKKEESADALKLDAFCGTPYSEKNGIKPDQVDMTTAEQQNIEEMAINEEAQRIWKSGKALEYICESIAKFHVGDALQVQGYVLSYASTKVKNGKGINIMVTGSAGMGKSHGTDETLEHLPKYAHDKSGYSDKALFYNPIPDGQVLVFDDQKLSEQMQGCIKIMTTNFKEKHQYKTVDKSLNGKVLNLPANCVIWIVKVEANGDDQIRDRCICFWVDESEEQDNSIRNYQNEIAKNPDLIIDTRTKDVSRKIWDFMAAEETVTIPYADDIIQKDIKSHRFYDRLCDLIKASAVMSAPCRNRNEKGYLEASISDLEAACQILNSVIEGVSGSKEGHPRANMRFLYDCLAKLQSDAYPRSELMEKAGISDATLTKYLKGTGKDSEGGLMEICPAITELDKQTGDARFKSILWNREVFLRWNAGRNSLFAMEPEMKRFWIEYEERGHAQKGDLSQN